MRTTLGLLAAFFLTSTARADDAADAKALVEKAVKAHGYRAGEKAATWKDKGKFTGGGFELEYTGDFAFQSPDKYRFAIDGEFGGMKVTFTVVANGNKAWESAMGQTQEVEGDKLDYIVNQTYHLNVTTLLPLLSDAGYQLATAPEKDVDGKKAVGVKVTRDKKTPITLYFDKTTNLLVKSETKVKDEFQAWKEVPEEVYYGDYKDAGGKKFFGKMRVVRDGKTMIDSTINDSKTADKLDPKLFEKP
jgi:outer membrane lipoprotein-sorting protein